MSSFPHFPSSMTSNVPYMVNPYMNFPYAPAPGPVGFPSSFTSTPSPFQPSSAPSPFLSRPIPRPSLPEAQFPPSNARLRSPLALTPPASPRGGSKASPPPLSSASSSPLPSPPSPPLPVRASSINCNYLIFHIVLGEGEGPCRLLCRPFVARSSSFPLEALALFAPSPRPLCPLCPHCPLFLCESSCS